MKQFKSKVIRGLGLGSKLGFPTINLRRPSKFNLEEGVYSCDVSYSGYIYKGVLYFGRRYTVDGSLTLEIHLLNFDGDLRGYEVEVKIDQFIRHPRKFSSQNELISQIKKDIAAV